MLGDGGWRVPIPGQGVPHPHLAGGGYLILTWPGGGTPLWGPQPPGTLGRYLGPVTRVPPPPGKDMVPVEVLWDGDGVPPRKDIGPVEVLCDGDWVPLHVSRQTPVKT